MAHPLRAARHKATAGLRARAADAVGQVPSHRLRRTLAAGLIGLRDVDPSAHLYGWAHIEAPQRLHVGADSVVGPGCLLDCRGGLTIGNRVSLGRHSTIWTGDHDARDPRNGARFAPVLLEDYAFVYYGVTILKGITIGTGAVVAACSVVVSDVEPFTIVGGNPARKIGERVRELDYRPTDFGPVWFG